MSKSRAWMPLYVGEYLRDTGHLSMCEHGAYCLLIMHYWSTGPLPVDDDRLMRIARATETEWLKVAPVVKAFFFERRGKLHHKRIDAEIERTAKLSEKRAQSGQKGGTAKALNCTEKQEVTSNSQNFASDLPEICQTHLHLPSFSNEKESPLPPKGGGTDQLSFVELDDKPLPDELVPKSVCETRAAFDAWNHLAVELGLPVAEKFSPGRQRKIRACLRDGGGLGDWMKALDRIRDSRFLRGSNKDGWKATIDFLLQPSSFIKVFEGQYGSKSSAPDTIKDPEMMISAWGKPVFKSEHGW